MTKRLNEEQRKLIVNNLDTLENMTKAYAYKLGIRNREDDFLDIMNEAICIAALDYNPKYTHMRFLSFAWGRTMLMIHYEFRKQRRSPKLYDPFWMQNLARAVDKADMVLDHLGLSTMQRTVLELIYWHDLKAKQIALQLKIPVRKVYYFRRLAFERIRRKLG